MSFKVVNDILGSKRTISTRLDADCYKESLNAFESTIEVP